MMQNLIRYLITLHIFIGISRGRILKEQQRNATFPQDDENWPKRSSESRTGPTVQTFFAKATNTKFEKTININSTSAWEISLNLKYHWKQILDQTQSGSTWKRSLPWRQPSLTEQASQPLLHEHQESGKPGSILDNPSHSKQTWSLHKHPRSSKLLQKNLRHSNPGGKHLSHTDQKLQEFRPHTKHLNLSKSSLKDKVHEETPLRNSSDQLHQGERDSTHSNQTQNTTDQKLQSKISSHKKHENLSKSADERHQKTSLIGLYHPRKRDLTNSRQTQKTTDQKLQGEISSHKEYKNLSKSTDERHQKTSLIGSIHAGETDRNHSRQTRSAKGWSMSQEEGRELYQEYYKCLKERLKIVKQPQFSIHPLISHVGQRVSMKCLVCVHPERGIQGLAVSWQFLRRTDSTLSVLDSTPKHRISSSWTLVIPEVTLLDVGQFYCTERGEYIAVYQLDVLTAERRRTVSEKSISGLAPVKILAPHNLELYTSWTQWSQCNLCDKPGHRRKIGLCMVKKFLKGKPIKPVDVPLMEFYTGGVPCRSTALPRSLSRLPAIRGRRSEILMGECNVTCPTAPPPVKITDSSGRVVEVLMPGYYSVKDKPKLPPMVKRKVQYQEAGIHLVLKCPHDEEEEEDVIIRWQRGKRKIDPRTIRRQTRGRVFVDQLNRLHIKKLLVADTAPYNCWNQKRHVATIKVIVVQKFNANIKDYISYGGFILTVVAVVLTCLCVCCRRGQRSGR